MQAARDYYAVLGVTPNSEDVVIQAAYKALMRKYHPDANRDSAMSKWASDFTEAFSVIGRADRRAEYDAQRWQLQRRGQPDRRAGDAAPPAPRDELAAELSGPERARPWKSWGKKAAGIVLGIIAAKLLTVLAASLDVRPTLVASRPSDPAATSSSAPSPVVPAPAARGGGKRLAAKAVLVAGGLPPIAKADIVRAARRIEHVFGRGGVAASVEFSRTCHARAITGGDWSSFDFCAAFDDAARMADANAARAEGASRAAYFIEVTSVASQIVAYAPLSRDGAALAKRLRDIRRRVAAHTGGSPPAASIRSAPAPVDG